MGAPGRPGIGRASGPGRDRVGTGSMTSQAPPPESALPCQVFPVELACMLASRYTRFEGPSSYTLGDMNFQSKNQKSKVSNL